MKEYTYDDIVSVLNSNIATVIFTKKDGTERTMECTLMRPYIPESVFSKTRVIPDPRTSVSVWDIEENNWRAFRLDSIKSFEVRSV